MSETDQVVHVASSTATGLRPANQDAAVALDLRASNSLWGLQAVVAVADGMGGHAAGDVASRIAADTITEVLSLQAGDQSPLAAELAGTKPADAMLYAVRLANQRIHAQAQHETAQSDMGTTLTVVALTSETALVAHVGDSRGYMLSRSGIHQITQDHSWVARQVREQRMTEEQAARSPLRNQVTRTLGVRDDVVPDVISIPLQPGSVYLVCSDGLSEVVSNQEIAEVVNTTATVGECCEALVNRALERGTRDNVTVACAEYGHLERGGAAASGSTQQEITQQLYPTLRTRSRADSPLAARRLMQAGIAAAAVVLVASVLLLRSCLLAPSMAPTDQDLQAVAPRPSASVVELPPIEQGLTVNVLVIDDTLVAAANRHVQITIHALEDADSEPRTTIGPDRDYTRALTDEEAERLADETCRIELWVQDDYVHWRTEPDDMDLYVNRRMELGDKRRLAELTGEPVRIGFYFPANDREGYTVALTQIDAGNLPVVEPEAEEPEQ